MTACSSSATPDAGIQCGNANPDPCICSRPPDPANSPQCLAEQDCAIHGGTWDFSGQMPDAGVWGRCLGFPADSGADPADGGARDAAPAD
jgi:hypothetical protein